MRANNSTGSSLVRAARRNAWLTVTILVHAICVVALFASPGSWPVIVAVIVANHALLTIASVSPRSRLLGPNLRRLPADAQDDQVALTFDDGPDPHVTPKLLRILAEHDAHASFFLVAQRAERYPDIVRAIADAGHSVENHSLRHAAHFALRGRQTMKRDIEAAQKILCALARRAPRYFRPPAGMRNPGLGLLLHELDLDLVSWTRRGLDTITRDPDRVLRRLVRNLRGGDILVLHEGSSARDSEGEPVVLKVLPRLLTDLEQRNLRAVAIPVIDAVLQGAPTTNVTSRSTCA
jgi:peptidoglycan/xylan/chitin deacetylase (PgdA/CDA1 family)